MSSQAGESWYREAYEHLPIPYQLLDPRGHLVTVNDVWLEMLGYSASEVEDRWFGDFLTSECHGGGARDGDEQHASQDY